MTNLQHIRFTRWSLILGFSLAICSGGAATAIDSSFPAAGTCEWPASLQLRTVMDEGHPSYDSDPETNPENLSSCSATYVGNRMVLTAAHCLRNSASVDVHFGEDRDLPAYVAQGVTCHGHPDGDWFFPEGIGADFSYRGKDIGYCVLPEDAPTPPYAPVMVPNGCEVDYLRDRLFSPGASPFGQLAKAVGSGLESGDSDGPVGTKRVGEVNLLYESYSPAHRMLALRMLQANLGQDITVRPGDSGSPALFEMPNGTWRVIGINTHIARSLLDLDGDGEEYAFTVAATSAPRFLHWIENHSGRDITPCHDFVAGQWQWGGDPGCGIEFDTSPDLAVSDWPGCLSSVLGQIGECAGWLNPAGDFLPPSSEADSILDFVLLGPDGAQEATSFSNFLPTPQMVGTLDDDTLVVQSGADLEVFGGQGNDSLLGGNDDDSLHGGHGDDQLHGRHGTDILIPGLGKDSSYGGKGNDVIVIQGKCELEAGELIDGGEGTDKLLSPLTRQELQGLGVRIRGIEQIILIHPEAADSYCRPDQIIGSALGSGL